MAAPKASTGKRRRGKHLGGGTSSPEAEELALPHKRHQGLLTEQQRKDYEEFTRLHTVHQSLLTGQQRDVYQAMLARHVHQQYQALLALQEQRRRWERGLRELPHFGAKPTIWSLRCDAPRGCPACVARAKIFSERSLRALEHAQNNFDHALRQQEAYSHYLKAEKGRDLSRLKGAQSRQDTIDEALRVYGTRRELRRGVLVRLLHARLDIGRSQIHRHLNHSQFITALEKAGKKII